MPPWILFLCHIALGFGLGAAATLFAHDYTFRRDLKKLRRKVNECKELLPYIRGLEEPGNDR